MLTDSKINLKTLNSDELIVIAARHKGIAFLDMTDQEFDISLTGIIFNISVICGCPLPTHPAHIEALEKEFSVCIQEYGFAMLTAEEVITAFRMNASGKLREKIETYNQIFNIDYASKVIRLYLEKRGLLDSKLTYQYEQAERDEEIQKEDSKRRKKISAQFELFIHDDNSILNLENAYMQLSHDKAFSDPLFFIRFADRPYLFKAERRKPESAIEYFNATYGNLDEKFAAQQRAVKYLFEQMKKSGKTKIYEGDILCYPGFSVSEDIVLYTPPAETH